MLQSALPERALPSAIVTDGLRILVLDESEFDLRRVSRLLSEVRSDVFVKTTKTLDEFETAFRANLYDLCLIDHTLSGGKTSSDAITVIKSSAIASQTPAILVTGMSEDNILTDAMRRGFAGYIDKSRMTVVALKTAISEALDEVVLTQATDAERLEMVSQVMDDVARLYSGNTKEHLSKIYQNTKFLRECIARREWPSPDAINEIESCCFSVWRFLDEVENHGMNFGRHTN
ncbi:MAG: response regulator [Pseudomonadota bacterium]